METSSKTSDVSFDLSSALARIAQWLPTQGPLKDFVHHNPLHAFQHLPFHRAIAAASRLYGAAGYLDVQCYLEAHRQGRITETALSRAVASRASSEEEKARLRKRMLEAEPASPISPGIARTGIRSRWGERSVNLDALIRPPLFKLLSNFLDQGISVWRMPHATDQFWSSVRRVVGESWFPLFPLSSEPCREILTLPPSDAIRSCLKRIVGSESHYERYLLELLLSHPGWSGMVHTIEKNPGSLLEERRITIEELVALELTLELGWLSKKLGAGFPPLVQSGELLEPFSLEQNPSLSEAQELQALWHEAFEWTYYEDVLSALEKHVPREVTRPPLVQAFFCLDERAGSLRRHLEFLEPAIETYGTAGFFGIDFLYQGLQDGYPVPYCPVAIKPRHLVRETVPKGLSGPRPRFAQRLRAQLSSPASSPKLFRGWLITQTLGLWHSITLAFQIFWPPSQLPDDKTLSQVEAHSRLSLLRESEEVTKEGYLLGYSIPEMTDRVFGILHSTGLTKDFAKLVVIIGHGSSSANNPHFAAYDCGACSGKPGGPNARAFVWMANHPQVREGLRQKGIVIPEDTVFLAAIHDTSRDEIRFSGLETVPEALGADLNKFRAALAEALARNAKERCRRFEMVDQRLSPAKALRAVRERSLSIFEPRPELNHATNAVAIVGRRKLSRGLFLDRRVFLSSYDPEQDPDGRVLSGILEAVVPVCGGINLEYYLSRVDNLVYGAGTKLPHNVVSLIGVSNGIEGDLRTGLPSQMIEVHDPVRLLLVVEQTPGVALEAVTQNPRVFEWIENQWIRLACVDPGDQRTYLFEGDAFVPGSWGRSCLPSAPDSLLIIQGKLDNLPAHEIGGTSP